MMRGLGAMFVASRILFWLALVGLTVPLTFPMFERAMSWTEAMPAVFAGLFFCTLFGVFCIAFPPERLRGDSMAIAVWRRRAGITYGLIGFLYCAILGTVVALVCQNSIDSASSSWTQYSPYSSGYDSLEAAYRRQDRYGRDLGIITAAVSIIPLIGMIVFAVRKPKPPPWGAPMGPYGPPMPMQGPPPFQGPYGSA